MFSWKRPPRRPIIIAHRGSSGVAPENTLAAFRQAVIDGADAIELDVRLSADGRLMVFHDAKLDRTTDMRGRIEHTGYDELQRGSAGSWFHPRFAAERIPTLEEVFEIVSNRVGVNIEIKTRPRRSRDMQLITSCLSIIRTHDATESTLVSSFHHAYLKQCRSLAPDVPTGALHHPVKHFRKNPSSLLGRLGADYFICSRSTLRARIVRDAHAHDVPVAVYTVNTEALCEKVLRAGVDALFTDFPAPVRRFIESISDPTIKKRKSRLNH